MAVYYDRYSNFRNGDSFKIVPFVDIIKNDTDKFEIYKRGETRLDLVSYQYYGSPNYAWLIMQANPEYGSLEYRIPDGSEIRIPFPLATALENYQKGIEKNKKYYG